MTPTTYEIMQRLHLHAFADNGTVDVSVEHLDGAALVFLETMLVNGGYRWARGKVEGARTLRIWREDD